MKLIKTIFTYIIEYVVGYGIFDLVYSFVQMIYMRVRGSDGIYFIDIVKNNLLMAIGIYTILFVLICCVEYMHNRRIAKLLNEKLKKGEKNEE